MSTDLDFRDTSKQFHRSMTKEDRQKEGIFFTPKKTRDLLFGKLAELQVCPKTILEPSFGTGEFLLDARRVYPDSHLVGVEKNEALFDSLTQGTEQGLNNCTLTCGDFLRWEGKADLILGNPPYFVWKTDMTAKEKKAFSAKHAASMTGRPNIYVMFLYKCLVDHLEPGGYLAFILPTSLYNCSYYQPMRDYLATHTRICHLETLNKPGFYETGQETTLLVLRKQENDTMDYLFKRGHVYLSPYYKELYTLTRDTQTLADLGLGVKTGNVVWNQVKPHLADEGTLLIYSSNITNSILTLNNLGGIKKQYVSGLHKPTLSGPVILVERGYGNHYRFNSVLVNMDTFYAENHINVIYPKTPEATVHLERVMRSFQDVKSQQFIHWFMGNGSMSATELETLFPIF